MRASSGTTLPASLAAIANRGEWTVSMMFDIYLGFAEPGDQYLGRLLAGLDPNKAEFATLPPHFVEGMENEYISEAMNLCFKGIMDKVTDDIMVVVDNDNGGGGGRIDNNAIGNMQNQVGYVLILRLYF